MPRYMRYSRDVIGHKKKGLRLAEDTSRIVDQLVNLNEHFRTLHNKHGLNEVDAWIDSLMDQLIVASGGDYRLALFQVTRALGQTLVMLADKITEESNGHDTEPRGT